MVGVWDYIPHAARPYVLGLIALAAIAPIPFVGNKNPFKVNRKDALRRLNERSGDAAVLPATMLSTDVSSEATEASKLNWKSYVERTTKEKMDKISVGAPKPKISAYALTAGLVLSLGLGISAYTAGDNGMSRFQEAFNFTAPPVPVPPPNVIAWIKPPDGIDSAQTYYLSNMNDHVNTSDPVDVSDVHEQSELHISVLGSMPLVTVNGQPLGIAKEIKGADGTINYQYQTSQLTDVSYEIQIESGPSWQVFVTPDMPPVVEITDLYDSVDSSLRLRCKAEDDFGIRSGQINLVVPGTSVDAEPPEQAVLPTVPVQANSFCR